jgi:AcrR family transcriptional regulator
MARVTKEPDVRREELLDVALALCVSVGFESTSVERITTEAGVAKGTFYHYFSSKQDLLAQLVRRFGDELFAHLEGQMAKVEGPAPDRFRALMLTSASWKSSHADASLSYVPYLYKAENQQLRQQLFSEWLERTRPLVLAIVEQGVREGTFDVIDPDATTSVLLSLWFDAASRVWERALATSTNDEFVRVMLAGVDAIWAAQERVLGAEAGSLTVTVDRTVLAGTRQAFRGVR